LQIYRDIVQGSSNLKSPDKITPEFELNIEDFTRTHIHTSLDYSELICTAIENIRLDKISQSTNQNVPQMLPELDVFFTDKQLIELININEPHTLEHITICDSLVQQ
jgi:hypothetical protein